ncbi:hypothetical protein [Nocardia sp. NPDC048505]|uniref:hypothetical protein n=1 Tax=unclassified Nocardia TaxID=2637762 RepID=UPI0034114FB9
MMRGIAQKTIVLAALAVAVVGCASGGEPAATTSRAPVTAGSTAAQPSSALEVGSTPAGSVTTAPPAAPAPSRPTATAVVRTVTLAQHAVPKVPVSLHLVTPCDPVKRDMPDEGGQEVLRFDGTTGADGRVSFTVPLGCYRMNMGTPPTGTRPVPEGMHTLFVPRAGETFTGDFRFQDPGWPPVCDAATIVGDLAAADALYPEQKNPALAEVHDCEGSWGVIRWNLPGDSQRIVRHNYERWVTYEIFPHDTCWTQAVKDGVPERLRPYFPNC